MDINETISERAKTHGAYAAQALIAQEIKAVLRRGEAWNNMFGFEAEAVDMIAHKLARIVSGNPHFHDHWHDIQGYAKLAADGNTVQS